MSKIPDPPFWDKEKKDKYSKKEHFVVPDIHFPLEVPDKTKEMISTLEKAIHDEKISRPEGMDDIGLRALLDAKAKKMKELEEASRIEASRTWQSKITARLNEQFKFFPPDDIDKLIAVLRRVCIEELPHRLRHEVNWHEDGVEVVILDRLEAPGTMVEGADMEVEKWVIPWIGDRRSLKKDHFEVANDFYEVIDDFTTWQDNLKRLKE